MKPFMDIEVPRCTLKTGQQKMNDFSVSAAEPVIETRTRSFDELSDVSEKIKELTKATIRVRAFDEESSEGKCIISGSRSMQRVYAGRAY